MEKKRDVLNLIKRSFGFNRLPARVEEHLREADVRSAMYLSVVVASLEIWMLVRYIIKYVKPGICDTVGEFFHYTQGYWTLLTTSVLIFIYAVLYILNKLNPILKDLSRIFIFAYFVQGIYFGVLVTISDLGKGRMITCFLSMVLYITMVFIWRPFISILMSLICGIGFVKVINTMAYAPDGSRYHMEEGDLINFVTFMVSLTILALCVYYQRYNDATKTHRLEVAAVTDELTGIPNMARFETEALALIEREFEDEVKPVFLVFDIVHFQTYNDTFGYNGGNELLIKMGSIMAEVFEGRPFARRTDDVFVAFAKGEDYEKYAYKVREALKAAYPAEKYLDVKVGVYPVKIIDTVVRHALDRAAYALEIIKNHEGKFIAIYDTDLSKKYKLRQYILNNIDRAVEKNYIKVYYQPVMDAKSGCLCGCEALARWDDPEMGFLSPGQFIPILEESRQIHKLDRCVYLNVCKNMRNCLDEGRDILPTSLNFSRLDFELMDAVDEIEELIKKYKISRDYLHVEITESALSEDVAGLQEAMDKLHKLGYVIWLDDFGSGYSSMNVLKDFKFDLLKIDMEFLKNISGNENAYKIIRKIIELSNDLGMKTLTEGVESEEAEKFLREAGCDKLQGFLYGRPVSYEELQEKIDEGLFKLM